MKSTTFGSASTSVARTKRIKKLLLPDATLSLMLDTLLRISSIKKEELSTASFSLAGAVPMESTANFCIKYHVLRTASALTKLKTFSVDLALAHTGKT